MFIVSRKWYIISGNVSQQLRKTVINLSSICVGRYSSPSLWWYWTKINKCASNEREGRGVRGLDFVFGHVHSGLHALLVCVSLQCNYWILHFILHWNNYHSIQFNNVYVITKRCLCACLCECVYVLPTGFLGSQQRSALVWACCYRLQVKDQMQTFSKKQL